MICLLPSRARNKIILLRCYILCGSLSAKKQRGSDDTPCKCLGGLVLYKSIGILGLVTPYVFSLSSCHPRGERGPRYQVGEFRISPKRNEQLAIPLRTESDCRTPSYENFSQQTKIWLRTRNGLELVSYDLSEISMVGLSGSGVKQVIVGFEREESYSDCHHQADGAYLCKRARININDAGALLRLCRHSGGYPKHSLENAALASIIGVARAFKQTRARFPGAREVEVLLFPRFVHTINAETSHSWVETNNAFWSSYSRENVSDATISFLPDKVTVSSKFWLQPGVGAHEYGHEIFFSTAPGLFSLTSGSLGSYGVGYTYHLTGRKIDVNLVRDAVNEAFADLISHYSFGDRLHKLGGIRIGYFRKARLPEEVASDDSETKALTAEFLQHFFSQESHSP